MTTGGGIGGGGGGAVDNVYINLMARLEALERELTRAENMAGDAGQRAGSRFSRAFEASAQVAGALAGIGAALLAAAGGAVVMAAKAEQSAAAFETLLGSATKAKAFLADLSQFAANTPFELTGLQDAARKLLAFGFTAEQILPMMRSIGDAVGALGGGAAEISRVTMALGQMQAKGKVSAEEMMQLAELGLPVWDMLAKKIGVTVPEAMKLAEKGAISAAQAIPALLEGMSDKFGGAMERQATTLMGLWSNLTDNVAMTATALGNRLVEALDLKGVASGLIEFMANVKAAVEGGGLEAALAQWQPAIIAVGGALAGVLAPALYAAAAGAVALAAPLLPFIAAGAAIALAMNAAGVSLADVGNAMKGAAQFAADLARKLDAQYGITERLAPIISNLGQVARAAFALIGSAWENILKPVFTALAPLLGGAVAAALDLFNGLLSGLKNVFAAFAALFAGDWEGFWNRLVRGVAEIDRALLRAAEVAFKAIVSALEKVGPLVNTALNTLAAKIVETVRGWRGSFEIGMTYAAEGLLLALKNLMPQWFTFGQNMADNLIAGLRQRRDAIRAEIEEGAAADASTATPAAGGATIQGAAALAAAATRGRAVQTQGYGVNAAAYGPGGHPGVDFRVGAPGANAIDSIYAPFAGVARLVTDKWLGRTVEITDALGQKILLGHLSAYSKDLVKAIEAGKGKAFVAAGQFLGREGGVPGTSGAGNSTGAHLDISALDANGRRVDPNSLRFQSMTGAPAARPPSTGTTPKPQGGAGGGSTVPGIGDVFTGGASGAATQAAATAADKLAAALRVVRENYVLGKVTGAAYTAQLAKIEAQAKAAALSATDPKLRTAYVGIYSDAQAAAKTYADGVAAAAKKSAKAQTAAVKDTLTELQARYAYVGESGKAAYKAGLNAFIAAQTKIVNTAKAGSAEQVAAMQNVSRARQLLLDADKKKEKELTDTQKAQAAIADQIAAKARETALRAASPAQLLSKAAKARAAGDLEAWSAIQSEIERRQQVADQKAAQAQQGRDAVAAQIAAKRRDAALRATPEAQLLAKQKAAEAAGDLALWSAIEREIERRAQVADASARKREQDREQNARKAAQTEADRIRAQIAGLKELSLADLRAVELTAANADLRAAVLDELNRRAIEAARGNAAAVADLADARADAAEQDAKRLEADMARALDAVKDDAAERLRIQEELGAGLLAAQVRAIDAREAADAAAEVARYEKAKADAEKVGGDLEALRVAYEARLGNITARYAGQRQAAEDAQGRAMAASRKALLDQLTTDATEAAQEWTEGQLEQLDRLTGAERAHVRDTLELELAKYQALGEAGKGAVKKIEDALARLAGAERKAAADLADLLAQADPTDAYRADIAAADPNRKETAAGAVAQATAGYSRVIEAINADLKELGDAYAQRDPAQITPAEAAAYAARKKVLEGLATEATKARDAAATVAQIEFDQKALDDAEALKLSLAEVNLTLDEAAGDGEGGRERYAAALKGYRDYWAGRVAVLKAEGGPAYLAALQALATAEQRIAQDTAAQTVRDAQDAADAAGGAVADIEARYTKLRADQGYLSLRQQNAQLTASLSAREAALRANYARDVAAAGSDARKKKQLEAQLQRDLTKLAAEGADERRKLLYSALDEVKAWANAIGEIASKLTGNDAFNGIAQGVGSAVDAFKAFSSGDIVGGIMAAFSAVESLGNAILNLSPGFRAWREGLLAVLEVQNKALGAGNTGLIGNPFEAALRKDAAAREAQANAGFWQRVGWALFGGAPQVMENAAGEALAKIKTVFDGLADGLSSTLENALLEGFRLGDFSKVGDQLKKAMENNVIKVIIQETLKAALVASGMADKLKNMAELIAEAIKTGNWGAVSAAMQDAYNAGMGAAGQVANVLTGLPGYGADAAQDASNALPEAIVNYAVAPSAVMSAPAWAVDWANAANRHAAALEASTPVLERIAQDGLYTRVELAGKIDGATLSGVAGDLLRTGQLG